MNLPRIMTHLGFCMLTAALASALVFLLRLSWTRIGERVPGSRIAATGLLLLGWTLSRQL